MPKIVLTSHNTSRDSALLLSPQSTVLILCRTIEIRGDAISAWAGFSDHGVSEPTLARLSNQSRSFGFGHGNLNVINCRHAPEDVSNWALLMTRRTSSEALFHCIVEDTMTIVSVFPFGKTVNSIRISPVGGTLGYGPPRGE